MGAAVWTYWICTLPVKTFLSWGFCRVGMRGNHLIWASSNLGCNNHLFLYGGNNLLIRNFLKGSHIDKHKLWFGLKTIAVWSCFVRQVLCNNPIENAEKQLRVSDLMSDEFKGNRNEGLLKVFTLIIIWLPWMQDVKRSVSSNKKLYQAPSHERCVVTAKETRVTQLTGVHGKMAVWRRLFLKSLTFQDFN